MAKVYTPLVIVAYRPLSTKLIADLLLLFGLCFSKVYLSLCFHFFFTSNFLLVAKISFYFESAKKTEEKFRENLDSRILKGKRFLTKS